MHDIETGPLDAVTFLVGEHQTVETLFVEYEGLSGTSTPDRRRSLVDRMIGEMRIHAAMEEQSFYPSVREMVAEGDSLVEEGLEEHAEAKEALAELEKMSEQDPAFDAKVESMISDMRHHVNEEENEVLPKLRHAVGESWLVELGQELRRNQGAAGRRRGPGRGDHQARPAPAAGADARGPPERPSCRSDQNVAQEVDHGQEVDHAQTAGGTWRSGAPPVLPARTTGSPTLLPGARSLPPNRSWASSSCARRTERSTRSSRTERIPAELAARRTSSSLLGLTQLHQVPELLHSLEPGIPPPLRLRVLNGGFDQRRR
jgi:hemerythrin superfamily protein